MPSEIKISAADLGTNTLKVTHATRICSDDLIDMEHASDTVRLGAGIESTGRIEESRVEACLRFLKQQEAIGIAYGSTDFVGVATEALRIAGNGADLLDRIHNETRWEIEIISGNREAQLTYLGLKDQVPAGVDCAIVDIGGGSTEVVVIQNDQVAAEVSVPIGSGRLADRFFQSDPPGVHAGKQAIAAAHEALDSALPEPEAIGFIMLAGGSGLFMNQLIEQMFGDSPFDIEQLRQLASHLAQTSASDTVERIDIPEARALVLPASVAVGVAVMERFSASSALGVPSGIRMGLIREYQ